MVVECIKKNQNYWVWKTWQGFYWCGCAGTCEVGWWCHCQWRRSAFFETSFIFWINLWVVVFWSTDGFFCKSTRLKHAEGWRRNTCNDIQGKLFSVFTRGVQKQRNERTQLDLGFLGFGGYLPAVQDSPNVRGYQNAAAAADKRWCRWRCWSIGEWTFWKRRIWEGSVHLQDLPFAKVPAISAIPSYQRKCFFCLLWSRIWCFRLHI